ncbi:MAG: metallophosphoesterase [Yoonia sp.]|uniref:metallophosphoesterase n=1 Tax=Yoonia sp. TaxID=2212373 RepID=UPI003EF2C9D2
MQAPTSPIPQTDQPFPRDTLAPAAPFWAIGDVHGCYDLLAPVLDRLLQTQVQIVLLGNYINKGPDSAKTLHLIFRAAQTGRVLGLRGNHEDLLLRFMERPQRQAKHFLRYGGNATLQSFGVDTLPDNPTPRQLSQARNDLRAKLGPLEDWLLNCPYAWTNGNVTAMHAGADPRRALDDQPEKTFAWGHPLFGKVARQDGQWVIHGHRPVTAVKVKDGRISINTQPLQSGILSAVRIAIGQIDIA